MKRDINIISMNKITSLLLISLFTFSLTACGESQNQITQTVENQTESTESINDIEEALEANGSKNTRNSQITGYPEFNFDTKTVTLNSGYEMPILGIGTYSLSRSEASDSVYWALTDGFRLIDTARIYGNETGVGEGIKRSGVPREEIFVTTKLWTADFDDAANAINEALERLDLEYIDLLLLHHTAPNDEEAYKAMEDAVRDGKVRSIGISNFYEEDFERIMDMATITPAVVQNETHPYNQSVDMKNYLTQYGAVMESWFPLGGRGNTQILFQDLVIEGIATAHGKSSAQVILRWHLQAGNIAIPGSSNQDHIAENYDIFDFELTDDEMEQMNALDKQDRFASY